MLQFLLLQESHSKENKTVREIVEQSNDGEGRFEECKHFLPAEFSLHLRVSTRELQRFDESSFFGGCQPSGFLDCGRHYKEGHDADSNRSGTLL